MSADLRARLASAEAQAELLAEDNRCLLSECVEIEARQHAASVRLGLGSQPDKLPATTAVVSVVGVVLSLFALFFCYLACLEGARGACDDAVPCCGNDATFFLGLTILTISMALLSLLGSRKPGAGGYSRLMLRSVTKLFCVLAGFPALGILVWS